MSALENLLKQGFELCPNMQGFSGYMGPFYEKFESPEQCVRALLIDDRHVNPEGVVHGGVSLSFMDYVIYRAIGDVVGHQTQFATINLNSQFLSAGKCNNVYYGRGSIVRQTSSVIFAEGEIYTDERKIMTATGIWKIIGRN